MRQLLRSMGNEEAKTVNDYDYQGVKFSFFYGGLTQWYLELIPASMIVIIPSDAQGSIWDARNQDKHPPCCTITLTQ